MDADDVDVGEWQSMDISNKPLLVTRELLNVSFEYQIPQTIAVLQEDIKPNLPWSEDHFQERVSGIPHNPPPSHEWWPFRQKNNEDHIKGGQFSHTYPERFWPKHAEHQPCVDNDENFECAPNRGIRFDYGDLADVVTQLQKSPLTRQAFLPVWFPEDTGAVHGERVPCSLGYHFIVRQGKLHIIYYIRSCDFLRHFPDDVYMAARLAQWVKEQVSAILSVGTLTMHITSLHVFQGDIAKLEGKV